MVSKFYGTFCMHCGKFRLLDSYDVARSEDIITNVFLSEDTEITCEHCGQTSPYGSVAHAFSEEGANHIFQAWWTCSRYFRPKTGRR